MPVSFSYAKMHNRYIYLFPGNFSNFSDGLFIPLQLCQNLDLKFMQLNSTYLVYFKTNDQEFVVFHFGKLT